MGFFSSQRVKCKKITHFEDLNFNSVDGYRLQLLIFLRRVGNGLYKSVEILLLSFIEKSYSSFPTTTLFLTRDTFFSADSTSTWNVEALSMVLKKSYEF